MNLDFSSLKQPVTSADIAAYKKSLGPQKKIPLIVYIIIGFAAFIYMALFIIGNSDSPADALVPTLITVGIAGVVGGFLVFAVRSLDKQRAKLYRFAVQNNLILKTQVLNPGYPGMIFDEGHARLITEAYTFPDGSEIGNYEYTIGSGKSQKTYHWSYARIKLTRRLPNMVLDAKQNNFFGKISNLPDSFSRGQVLALEGDFNKYFTLYAPQQYERDALYVFTPDVMAAVVDAGQAYDMEVVDDNLMLYSSNKIKLDSSEDLTRILTILDKIGTELRDQSKNYADDRVPDLSQNVVAAQGRRLATGVGRTTIIILIAVFIYIVNNLISTLSD